MTGRGAICVKVRDKPWDKLASLREEGCDIAAWAQKRGSVYLQLQEGGYPVLRNTTAVGN